MQLRLDQPIEHRLRCHTAAGRSPLIQRLEEIESEIALESRTSRRPGLRWLRFFGLWSLLAFVATPTPGQTASPEARPRVIAAAQVLVRVQDITLGDVAQVTAADAASDRALRAIYLAQAPRLGQRLALNRQLLLSRLAQSGWGDGAVELDAPATIVVEREAQVASQAALEAQARTLLPAALPHDPGAVVIDRLRLPAELALPPGGVLWEIELTGPRRTLGTVAFQLVAMQGGEPVATASGTAQIDVETTLVEAVQDIPRGTVITPDLVREARGLLSRLREGALGRTADATGLVAAQTIRAGQPLTARSVEMPRLVRRGQEVTMVYESRGLRITHRAVAAQDGAAGDEISVRNPESQQTLQALVMGEGLVRVLR